MTVITLIEVAIRALKVLGGETGTYHDRLAQVGKILPDALKLLSDVYEACAERTKEHGRLVAAAGKNPALQKPLAMLALLVLPLALASCGGRVRNISETETRYAGYGVQWPADASRNPVHYHTILEDGRMVTTTRKGT
jgi:hypothetical protein